MDYYDQVRGSRGRRSEARIGEVPSIGIVLGSGLGGFVESLDDAVSVPYERAAALARVTQVAGHDGRVVVGKMRGRTIIALAGRCHVYEGHSLPTVTFAVRVLGLLGVRVLILTNAAGGIHTGFAPGALMVIDDHVNLMGSNPLVGPNDDRFGPRFPDMSEVYSAAAAQNCGPGGASRLSVPLVAWHLCGRAGPSYETPAEIRYLRTIGVDAVGMSTVPEAIVARHMGIEVLGLSCISNMAAGISAAAARSRGVVETTRRARGAFSSLLEGIVGQL